MKTSSEKPPMWDECCTKFGAENLENAIFTYGDTVYNVKEPLSKQMEAHEAIHMKQQGDEPEKWWTKYLVNETFRINQEAEAYGAQYAYVCKMTTNSRDRARILMTMCHQLCKLGDITYAQASKLIYAN